MRIFVTGGTGYIGSRLIPSLTKRGHDVKALVRRGSGQRLPAGVMGVTGDALQMDSYANHVRGSDTFVYLIGTAHPSPERGATGASNESLHRGAARKAKPCFARAKCQRVLYAFGTCSARDIAGLI